MASKSNNLKEIAQLFLKLGCIAFGGPAAHIAMLEQEVVTKRKWLTSQHFLDLVGATNLIPGPNSTEMVMHCGYERGGYKGLLLAGICFIFPAVSITGVLAYLYIEYGQLPNVEPFIYGIKPAVLSIIIMAAYKLGKKALKNYQLGILGGVALVAALSGINEIVVLLGCGFLGSVVFMLTHKTTTLNAFSGVSVFFTEEGITVLKVFLSFLKVGAILYGSGYVLFAFLDAELVAKGWLTRQELLDAIAAGQFTPGPVLTTATFVGWQLKGFYGAIVATLGVFLPSFIFVAILNPLLPKLKSWQLVTAFLDAVNVAAVAIIVAVCLVMAKDTLTDWRTISIAILSVLVVFLAKKVNNAFVVLGGGILGYLLWLV